MIILAEIKLDSGYPCTAPQIDEAMNLQQSMDFEYAAILFRYCGAMT